jgi:hypothetical protein
MVKSIHLSRIGQNWSPTNETRQKDQPICRIKPWASGTVTMEQESMDFTLCMETEMFHPSGSYYQDPVPQLIFVLLWRPRWRAAYFGGGATMK